MDPATATHETPDSVDPRTAALDRVGIVLSTICLIHCTALPLAMAGLQAYGASLLSPHAADSNLFHAIFAILLLGVGTLAFGRGFRQHRQWLPPSLGAVGTIFLLVGAFNPGGALSELGEHAITIAGTLTLLYAHARNRRPFAGHHCHDESCGS